MEVGHLIDLAQWYEEYVPSVIEKYQGLATVLEHNATQPQKQPVRDTLTALIDTLSGVPMEVLTSDQIHTLDDLGVLHLLGTEGAEFVNRTVTQGEYDPASVSADIKAAHKTLVEKRKHLTAANSALEALNFETSDPWVDLELPIVRVRFQDEAAISDIHLLKKWSADWYDIARGVALVAGESPNEVRVVGAANGSIILTLAATYSITRLLAAIAKHVAAIIHEGLQVTSAIEDLRQKKLLTKTIEEDLKKTRDAQTENGVDLVLKEVLAAAGKRTNGEAETALRKSIEKYLAFTKKGGDVDFLPPPSPADDDDEGDSSEHSGELKRLNGEHKLLRKTIDEVRDIQAQIRLLTHQKGQGS